jgi:PQQ-dependent dehydrogenase (s-GDH family)
MNNKFILLYPLLLLLSFGAKAQNFTMRPVKCAMEMPWEITYGPDNFIWATEARGYKVSRINPATGVSTVLLDLSNNKNFVNYPSVSPQGGLMGMALHPYLLTGKPYVYLAYVYQYVGGAAPTGQFFKTKVVRYTYNATAQTLVNEEVICDTIPGSNDHNGGRMTIANVNGAPYLYYGVGDMGGGQFDNANRPNKAQDPTSYEGKILRFNLEPDTDIGAFEKWIPNDGLNTFGRAVWSIGHRNPQGLVAGINGNLYESEHGPYSDDELNLLNGSGRNFGHPLVVGMADGNYNGAAVGAGTGAPLIVNEATNAANLGVNYRNPMKSFFPNDNATILQNYQNAVNNTPPVPNYFLSWNSIAPSGIAYYGSNAIPNWQNSILITSLKRRRVYRLQLDSGGSVVVGDTIPLFADMGRFRDLAISPDGTKIYVSCDSEGQTSGATAGSTIDPPNKGCILEFTYAPVQTGAHCTSKSSAPWNEWISNVTFSNINNPSEKVRTDRYLIGYSDWTDKIANVSKGQTYPLSITPSLGWIGNLPNIYCRVWIDWNANGIFEDTEKVLEGTNVNPFTVNVLVPTTATVGTAKMRVSLKNGGYPTACESFPNGEVEDYTVNIQTTSNTCVTTNCPPNITVNTTTNSAVANWTTPTLSGTCGGFVLLASVPPSLTVINSGASFPVGVSNIRYDVFNTSDGSLKDSSCRFNVTVVQTSVVLPDLTLANLIVPTPSVQQGQTLSFYYDEKNIGASNASGNFNIKSYLSVDQTLSADDYQNGSIGSGNFPAGLTQQVAASLTVNATVAAGNYYLIVNIDSDNTISESNENNNVVVSTATISVTSPQTGGSYCTTKGVLPWEYWVANVNFNTINNTSTQFKDFNALGYSDYTNLSTSLNKGQSYPLSITPGLSWIGNLPNAYCRVWIDFNGNKTFEANELILEKTNANPLTANVLIPPTAITGAMRMRVSVKFGAYPTACETMDKGEVEDYTVNIGGTVPLPDFTVRNLTVASPIAQNTVLPIGYSQINIGQSDNCAPTNGVRYYISQDSIWSPSTDILLNLASSIITIINTTPPYPITNISIALPANLVGNYYLIVVADPENVCVESDETNNYQAKPFVIQANTTIRPDLQLQNLVAPTTMTIGQNYTASINVLNTGLANNCGNESLVVVLSTDTIFSSNDIIAHPGLTWVAGSLPPNANLLLNYGENGLNFISIPASTPVGAYKLLAKINANNVCAESNPVNNTAWRDVTIVAASSPDIALSLTSTPSVFTKFAPLNFIISAKTTGSQSFTNVKIEFKFPINTTTGGTATPSVGIWQEWCNGGIQCYTWTIPTLAANTTATLNVPLYVLNATAPIVAIAKLLSSTPVDNVVANNTATLTVNPVTAPVAQTQAHATQLIPIVIQRIAPNPSDGELFVDLESLDAREVSFDFANAVGQTILTEKRAVEKGLNRVQFEVSALPQGIYMVSPSTNQGRKVPTKFVKM